MSIANSLTIDSLVFDLQASDISGGSVRNETSRGATLPETLTIKHSKTVDSATKRKVSRSITKLERTIACAEGGVMPVSAHIVVQYPVDSVVPSAEITTVIDHLVTILRTASQGTGGLELASDIFVKRLQ